MSESTLSHLVSSTCDLVAMLASSGTLKSFRTCAMSNQTKQAYGLLMNLQSRGMMPIQLDDLDNKFTNGHAGNSETF